MHLTKAKTPTFDCCDLFEEEEGFSFSLEEPAAAAEGAEEEVLSLPERTAGAQATDSTLGTNTLKGYGRGFAAALERGVVGDLAGRKLPVAGERVQSSTTIVSLSPAKAIRFPQVVRDPEGDF